MPFLALLGLVVAVRLVAMQSLPFIDTSEPRYAEIARLMMISGDWITPWFSPGVPFWGKPPLSFWAQAASFKLFGVSELAGRLPSLLATGLVATLLFKYCYTAFSIRIARLAVWIFVTSLLTFVASGAVLTDPFLLLATTMCMVSLPLAAATRNRPWHYVFFLGLALGALAKGPVGIVISVSPIVLSSMWTRSLGVFKGLPWATGVAMTATLVVPWYVLAEGRTPGFLHYFLVGEHVLRFIEPGWKGDLYGSAHLQPYGMIWREWLVAAFPWSLVALVLLGVHALRRGSKVAFRNGLRDPRIQYLLPWTFFPIVFFTVAHNILWTYVLPSLPAFAALLALAIDVQRNKPVARWPLAIGMTVPVASLVAVTWAALYPLQLKTEKELIARSESLGNDARLVYVGSRPFSARFYSQGRAESVGARDVGTLIDSTCGPLHLVAAKSQESWMPRDVASDAALALENKRNRLWVTTGRCTAQGVTRPTAPRQGKEAE